MKKLLSIVTIIFVMISAVTAQTVAVFDFACDDESFNDKVAIMTDLLSHQLVQDGNVTLVERKNLDYVKQELNFQMEGWTDSATVKEIGKMLNADCIIIGNILTITSPSYITARMIEVETGKILHSAKMTLEEWSDYEKQLPKFAKDCVAKMPVPDYFLGTWRTYLSSDLVDYEYHIQLKEKGKCFVEVYTCDSNGNEVTQTANGTYSHDKDFFRLNANFRGGAIKNLKKLDWKSVYVFDSDKTSFNILVPVTGISSTTNTRITLVKIE